MSRRKLRVLLTRCWSQGGGQVWAHEFASRLAELGHDVQVVFLRSWWPGMRKSSVNSFMKAGETRYRPFFLDAPLFAESCRLTGFLRRHLKRDPAEVIVSTGSEAALVPLVCRAGETRHVASFHSTYPDWIGLRQLIAQSVNLTRLGIARTYGHWTQHLDRFSMVRADQVVCSSEDQALRAVGGLKIPTPKIKIIYYGIDVERFTPHREQHQSVPGEILYAGGPCPSKGIDTLLPALSNLRPKFPEFGITFVGSGDWTPYQERAKTLGLGRCIKFVGQASREEMVKLYRNSYLLVAPTRHESFGLAVGEAMACGLPVVSTRATSIPEIVEDGITGLLTPVDDSAALSEALEALLGDPIRAAAMGEAGRARVEERFAWERIIGAWERLLLEVAEGKIN